MSENIYNLAQENKRLISENRLNALCSYYDKINEFNASDINMNQVTAAEDKLKNINTDTKVNGKIGEFLDDVSKFIVKDALPVIADYAKSAWESLSDAGRTLLKKAGDWIVKNQDIIFLAIDIIDWAMTAVFVIGVIVAAVPTGGLSLGGLVCLSAKVAGKTLLKKGIKKIVLKTSKKFASKVAKSRAVQGIGKVVNGTVKTVKVVSNVVKHVIEVISKFLKFIAHPLETILKAFKTVIKGTVKKLTSNITKSIRKKFRSKTVLKFKRSLIHQKNAVKQKYAEVVTKRINKLYNKIGSKLGGRTGAYMKKLANSKVRRQNRAKVTKFFIKRKIRRCCEFIKRIVKCIEAFIALLKFLLQSGLSNDSMHTKYEKINLLRRNIYEDKISINDCPPDVNTDFLKKWEEEGLENDNRDIFVQEIKEFYDKCEKAKINQDFVKGLITYTLNAVDLSKDEYLLNYTSYGKEIKQENENSETGVRDDDKMKLEDTGNVGTEAEEDFEDYTDILEKYFIKNEYQKNANGSEFVNEKTKVKFKLNTLTKIYWNIMHQFVVSMKD